MAQWAGILMGFPFPFPERCRGFTGNGGREALRGRVGYVAGGSAADAALADEVGEDFA
jgi:hypothetical protein